MWLIQGLGRVFLGFTDSFFCSHTERKEEHAMEYAMEYGFLRLSHETRKKLGITVMTIELGVGICFLLPSPALKFWKKESWTYM